MSTKIQANGIDINYVFDGPKDAPVLMFSNSLASNLQKAFEDLLVKTKKSKPKRTKKYLIQKSKRWKIKK